MKLKIDFGYYLKKKKKNDPIPCIDRYYVPFLSGFFYFSFFLFHSVALLGLRACFTINLLLQLKLQAKLRDLQTQPDNEIALRFYLEYI